MFDTQDRLPNAEELRRLVVNCNPLLRDAWAARCQSHDILVLADVRLPEHQEYAVKFWGPHIIGRAIDCANGHPGDGRPMFPVVQPRMHIMWLEKHPDPAYQRAAGELQTLPCTNSEEGNPFVPLVVAFREGVMVTRWCPPGTLAELAPHDPFADHLAN